MDNKKFLGPLAALVMMMGATTANAEGLSYSYVQFGYDSVDISGISGDGYGIGASFGVSDAIALEFSYSSVESELLDVGFGPGTITLSGYSIGGVWHTAVSDKADFLIGLGYTSGTLKSDVPAASGSLDANATVLSAGFRALATDNLELDGTLAYVSGDGSSDTTWQVGGLYHFDRFGVGLAYSDDENVQEWIVGFRFEF